MTAKRQTPVAARHGVTRFVGGTLLVLVVFAVLASFTYLIPDSAGYLSWGRSLLWDGDVDFTNEYGAFGMIERETNIRFGATTEAGRPGNPFGLGTALLWMPFLVVARACAMLGAACGAPVGTDGFTTGTVFAASLGTWTFVLVAWQFVGASVRLVSPDAPSRRLGVAAAFLAMPLPYYTLQLATYSHAASVLAISLVLYATLRWRDAPTGRHAVTVGLLLALAAAVRLQNLVFVALPLCLWFGAMRRQRRWLPVGATLLVSALAGGVLQAVAWGRVYGSPLTLPQGDGFLAFSPRALVDVLLATRHGLLTWSPIVLLAAVLLWRHRRRLGNALSAGIVACFALVWVLNAVPVDWWAGWSFGARRFCSLIPLLAVVLATAQGRLARGGMLGIMALNLAQWLRIATRQISGEADPGLNGLWGSDFLAFLAKVPEAMVRLAATPWDSIAVLARPEARGLSLRPDPPQFLWVLFFLWTAAVLAGMLMLRLRLGSGAGTAGNSRRAERV